MKPKNMAKKKQPPQFKVGDYVEVRPEVLEKIRRRPATPIEMCHGGWPNEFRVLAENIHEGEQAVMIDPCCRWVLNPATGEFLCKAHPARLFRKLKRKPKVHPREKLSNRS